MPPIDHLVTPTHLASTRADVGETRRASSFMASALLGARNAPSFPEARRNEYIAREIGRRVGMGLGVRMVFSTMTPRQQRVLVDLAGANHRPSQEEARLLVLGSVLLHLRNGPRPPAE
jgi:hypothetical protein